MIMERKKNPITFFMYSNEIIIIGAKMKYFDYSNDDVKNHFLFILFSFFFICVLYKKLKTCNILQRSNKCGMTIGMWFRSNKYE